MSSIPLNHLPLRPSTMQLLQKQGFLTFQEIEECKLLGGMNTLAIELGVALPQAARVYREIQSCLNLVSTSKSSELENDDVNSINRRNLISRNNAPVPLSASASELLSRSTNVFNTSGCANNNTNTSIVTFSRHADQMLGGGIALGELTEIYAQPGVGKTQLAMQLAVNAMLPAAYGGVQSKRVIYIDTEGSFSPERCHDMAVALVKHVSSSKLRFGTTQIPPWFTVDNILQQIRVYRVHDWESQIALIEAIPDIVKSTNEEIDEEEACNTRRIALVIVDSIAFHYRALNATFDSHNKCSNQRSAPRTFASSLSSSIFERTRLLAQQANKLQTLATSNNLAVVVINQMTTKIVNNVSQIVPALGESWAHAVTTRIGLSYSHDTNRFITNNHTGVGNPSGASHAAIATITKNRRTLHLAKSPRLPSGTADFYILQEGIRGVDQVEKSLSAHGSSSDSGSGAALQQQNRRPPSGHLTGSSSIDGKRLKTGL